MRQEDWFEGQDREVVLHNFWCIEKKYVYDDIYMAFGHTVRPMQPINMQLLRGKSEFVEAVEVTGKMGLHHLMGLQCHYNVTLLKQFYATLVIKGDEARTLKWMPGNIYCEATFYDFAKLLDRKSVV